MGRNSAWPAHFPNSLKPPTARARAGLLVTDVLDPLASRSPRARPHRHCDSAPARIAHCRVGPRHQEGFPFLVLLRAARRWPRDFMERSICSPHLPRQQTTRFPLPLSFDSDSANAYKKSIRRNSLIHPVRLLVGVRP